MKFIFIIILDLIIINFCYIPNWDFSKNSIELTNFEFDVFSKTTYDITAKVIKKINKNSTPVSFQNYVNIYGVEKAVGFEDIDSVYLNELRIDGYLVCPRSKYHPFKFKDGTYMTLNSNFNNGDDFQLKCYKHNSGYFIIAYLTNGECNFFVTKNSGENWDSNSIKLYNGVFDFDLNNENDGVYGEYIMVYLTLDYNYLKFKGTKLTLKSDSTGRADCSTKELLQAKTHSKGYFKNGAFYYITYDKTSFNCGYSTTGISLSYCESANNAEIVNNLTNPFDFDDEIEIEEMNFIENTVYVYYILTNKRTGKKNYGLINMIYNQIIYNTDEEIISFVPYTSNQMLAITPTSAYKICAYLNKNGDDCIEHCTGDNVLDIDGNKCASECGEKKLLYPQNICIITCDTNFYVIKDNKCGLCKDLMTSTPNKLINNPGCMGDFDENIYEYYNEGKKLLQCKSEYKLENNEYIPINVEEPEVLTEAIIILPSTQAHEEEPTEAPPIEPEPTEPETTEPEPTEPEPIETNCKNKRCLTCNSLSEDLELCLSCDESKYKKVNYTNSFPKYFDCIEEKKLETKYYLDSVDRQYKPCYELCLKCSGPGNASAHNCLECEDNYMFRPGDNPYNNCVVKSDFYYLSPYNEYKPLSTPQCPEVAKYKVKSENHIYCIYDCKEDKKYTYLYNGNCLSECPEGTTSNDKSICIENNPNKIYIGNDVFYSENSDEIIKSIENIAKIYAEEFKYTDNHISTFSNDEYNVLIYKSPGIIGQTELKAPNIDFGECYELVQKAYNITENLIISIADKKVKNNPSTNYLFFHPISGIKLETSEICRNKSIKVNENILTMLDEKSDKYELQKSLTDQGINIFDINDPYYKDLCYDFDNPKNRDIALKDRIKETYVNVTLCDDGCINTGIDIVNKIATCDCKFNVVTNNDFIHENAAIEYLVGEFFDIINSSNILVLKCYKYLLKYFTRSKGGMLILTILILCIIFTVVFFSFEFTKMRRYIFSLTEKYTSFLANYSNVLKLFPPKRMSVKNKTIKDQNNEIKKNNIHRQKKQNSARTIIPNSGLGKERNSQDLIISLKNGNSKLINIKEKHEETENANSKFIEEGKNIKKFFKDYLSTSPDDMEFDDAIKKDKRSFCRFLLDIIEEKQSLAYTFISSDPINTRMIKFILFSLNITLYFVVNGLFYSEDYISELYHTDEKDETFFSFVPRTIDKIIYTTLVSLFIGYLTDFFFLDVNKIKGIFKRDKENRTILKRNIALLIREIQKRYLSFIIMTFLIIIISLYYILCFNYVYPKTQIEWIKSSILIIFTMQILSLLKCLFEALFRLLSFNCESDKLYKISKIFDNNT